MIGIFDSGSGGLTVLKEIRSMLPQVDVVYFGDTANMPYGEKGAEEICTLTKRGIGILQKNGATHVVSACNSVSVSVTKELLAECGIAPRNFVEMVTPTVSRCSFSVEKEQEKSVRMLVCATSATVRSGAYQKGLCSRGIQQVDVVAMPELVCAIEAADMHAVYTVIYTHLQRIHTPPSHILLGCTHYPIAIDMFKKATETMGWHGVEFVNPATFVAKEVAERGWNVPANNTTKYVFSEESHVSMDFVERVLVA